MQQTIESQEPLQLLFPSKIDSSILSTFDSCKQRGLREYILGLTHSAISPDLHCGGAFAKGLEVSRHALWVRGDSLSDATLRGAWAISDYWGDVDPEPEKHGKPHIKSLVNTVAALYSYFEEYDPNTDGIEPYYYGDGKPAIEFTFAIPMEVNHPVSGEPIIFCGRCDLLGHFNDFFCVVDEKTTTSLGTQWVYKWAMRGQFIGYCYAAQHYGLPISSALIRGIAFQVKEFKHMQVIEQYPQWQIDRWWQEANAKVQHLVDIWNFNCEVYGDTIDSPTFTQFCNSWQHSYGDACDSYGGCPYRKDICTCENPEDWLSEFDIRRWDPLKKNPAVPILVGGNN